MSEIKKTIYNLQMLPSLLQYLFDLTCTFHISFGILFGMATTPFWATKLKFADTIFSLSMQAHDVSKAVLSGRQNLCHRSQLPSRRL